MGRYSAERTDGLTMNVNLTMFYKEYDLHGYSTVTTFKMH